MAQQVHSMAGWQGGSVVTDDWHPIPNVIAPLGVRAKMFPTSAFIDVAIGANHEAEDTYMINKCTVKVYSKWSQVNWTNIQAKNRAAFLQILKLK